MQDWKEIDELERQARIALWAAAEGDPRKWSRWIEGNGGAAAGHPLAVDAPEGVRAAGDAEYPAELLAVEPAGILFVRGRLEAGRRVAVVGSRDAGFEGERLARAIVQGLVAKGVAIVSGGALGIDTVAHQTALDSGGVTIAFVPAGFDKPTPVRNRRLFEEIAAKGALVSEYPPNVSARKYFFRRRNALIVAYSDAVLVVRAKERSGTMMTARIAQKAGKPLFAVPGSPEDPTSMGCLQLIREGAELVRHAGDIVEAMRWGQAEPAADRQRQLPLLSDNARAILQHVNLGEVDRDNLARMAGLNAGALLVAILELEMAGLIQKVPGGTRYRRR